MPGLSPLPPSLHLSLFLSCVVFRSLPDSRLHPYCCTTYLADYSMSCGTKHSKPGPSKTPRRCSLGLSNQMQQKKQETTLSSHDPSRPNQTRHEHHPRPGRLEQISRFPPSHTVGSLFAFALGSLLLPHSSLSPSCTVPPNHATNYRRFARAAHYISMLHLIFRTPGCVSVLGSIVPYVFPSLHVVVVCLMSTCVVYCVMSDGAVIVPVQRTRRPASNVQLSAGGPRTWR